VAECCLVNHLSSIPSTSKKKETEGGGEREREREREGEKVTIR
jgi:hypothetical protein